MKRYFQHNLCSKEVYRIHPVIHENQHIYGYSRVNMYTTHSSHLTKKFFYKILIEQQYIQKLKSVMTPFEKPIKDNKPIASRGEQKSRESQPIRSNPAIRTGFLTGPDRTRIGKWWIRIPRFGLRFRHHGSDKNPNRTDLYIYINK